MFEKGDLNSHLISTSDGNQLSLQEIWLPKHLVNSCIKTSESWSKSDFFWVLDFFPKKEKLNLDFFLLSQETWLLCVFNIFLSNQANPREVLANCIQALQQKQEQYQQK